MLAQSSPGVHDPWRDIDGTHIVLFCQVKQVADSAEPTALPSRRDQHGQVVGLGLDCLYVRFPDNQVISLPPELVRVLDTEVGGD